MEQMTAWDRELVMKLQEIQDPNVREVDVKLLLSFIEDIVQKANPAILQGANSKDEEASQIGSSGELQNVAKEVCSLSSEVKDNNLSGQTVKMTFLSLGYEDIHAKAIELFKKLSSYRWDAKVVLVLAVFAMKYGDVTLIAELHSTNQLANAIGHIRQPPGVKLKSEEVVNLIRAMLDVTRCIIHFSELLIPDARPEISCRMVIAVYWTIRSVVAMIANIRIPAAPEKRKPLEVEVWAIEISSLHWPLADQLNLLLKSGQKQPAKEKELALHMQTSPDNLQIGGYIGKVWVPPILQKLCISDGATSQANEKTQTKTSPTLTNIFNAPGTDNIKVLKAFLKTKKTKLPLFDGSTKKPAGVDILKKKDLLLLISDIDFSFKEDLSILRQIHTEARQQSERPGSQYDYEALWLPINDSTPMDEGKQKEFQKIQVSMPWCSVSHPSMLRPSFINYAKHVWNFDKKTMVVVLDQQGTVVNTNSLHMIRIWGSGAFPFTSLREEQLWKEERWSIELLVHSLEPMVIKWIKEEKYVCLYGGTNMEWIKNFKAKAQKVADVANIPLKMLYVGKSNPGINNRITSEKLTMTSIRLFWARLESMWHSLVQVSKSTESDSILREIMLVFEFDYSDQGWAVIGDGAADQMAEAKGDQMLKSFASFDAWKTRAARKGFLAALCEQLHQYHYSNLMSPGTSAGNIPELLVCSKCNCRMEKFIGYHCPME